MSLWVNIEQIIYFIKGFFIQKATDIFANVLVLVSKVFFSKISLYFLNVSRYPE